MRISNPWLGAAVLPVIAFISALIADVDPSRWSSLSAPMFRPVLADALLLEVLLLLVAAPLAGVALRGQPARLLLAAAVTTGVSALGLLIGWHALPGVFTLVGASHASLFSAALLLAALGAWAASRWRDPLDAAAISIGAILIVTIGPLLAGPLTAAASARVVNALLAINPLVSTAAGADIDVLRMDVLYQLSPIAHRQFDYPSWPISAGLFLACAGAVLLRTARRHQPASTT